MPDKLKVRAGQRVDLVDYVHGANTYTQESQKTLVERTLIDRRARVLDGFRVRVEDQTLNPGMITVFNGNAVDRDGQLINNEQTANDSRSITLLGTNSNFYVEIEFIEVESATDARFFWDPTTPNTAPEPAGSEFALNVATRLVPDWRVVTPVSTTGFAQSTDPNSVRVPVGVFRTNGSNEIVVGAGNPGLTLVRAAAVLESDVAIGEDNLRVLDARIFPATFPFNVTVDFGGTSPESRVCTAVDRANGILTLSVPLASAHAAGAIVRVTSGNADLVRENTDPSDPTLDPTLSTPGHPDASQRMWQANEVRGSALSQSKETFGVRDDLNIKSLKDEIDFLSAQLREMKFGHPRPETVSAAPPSSFASRPRYFDPAGSITGARTNSVSIGNGTTTFGDFNGTDGDALFTAALAALPAAGGTIFVKAGTYVFSAAVNITKSVRIVGENYGSTILSNQNVAGEMFTISAATAFEQITLQVGGGGAVGILNVTAAVSVSTNICVFVGRMIIDGVNAAVRAQRTAFVASGSSSIFDTANNGVLYDSNFLACSFTAASGVVFSTSSIGVVLDACYGSFAALFLAHTAEHLYNIYVSNSYFTVANYVMLASTAGALSNISIHNSTFNVSNLIAGSAVFSLAQSGGNISNIVITDTRVAVTGGTTSAASAGYVLYAATDTSGELRGLRLHNVDFSGYASGFVDGVYLDVDSLADQGIVSKSTFYGIRNAIILGGATNTLDSGHFIIDGVVHDNAGMHAGNVAGVSFGAANTGLDVLKITNCIFKSYTGTGTLGSRVGVDLNNNTRTGAATIEIHNNTFYELGAGSSIGAYGVRWNISTAGNVFRTFKITNNDFFILNSENSGVSAAVYLYNSSGTNNLQTDISNNRIDSVGEYLGATPGDAFGIYVRGADARAARTSITHNQINGITSAGAATPASGIEVANCSRADISHNVVGDVNAVSSSIGAAGACIRIGDGSGAVITSLNVSDNICDQSISLAAGEAEYCIIVNPAIIDGFHIDRNICRTSTSSSAGMYISGAASAGAALTNGSIDKNIIAYRDTSATINGYGLRVALGGASYGLTVDGNIVEETTSSSASGVHVGISVVGSNVGGTTRAVSVSNNVILGVKSGSLVVGSSRFGLLVRNIQRTKICGNIVDWNEPSVVEGIGLSLSASFTVSGHVVTHNYIRSDNSGVSGNGINIGTSNVTYGLLDANQVTDGASAVGSIDPAVAAGNWTYGTNKT